MGNITRDYFVWFVVCFLFIIIVSLLRVSIFVVVAVATGAVVLV